MSVDGGYWHIGAIQPRTLGRMSERGADLWYQHLFSLSGAKVSGAVCGALIAARSM